MTGRRETLTRLLRTAIVILGVSLATLALEMLHLLDRFETTGLDAFNVFAPTRDPGDVVVIAIQDDDYANTMLFSATSPLACGPLFTILDAIAAGRPKVIGVDLDTSAQSFGCLKAGPDWPPMVWAQDATWNPGTRTFTAFPALGGAANLLRSGVDREGIGQLPQDPDGVIRRYARELPIDGGRSAASFPWAVVQAGCTRGCEACCEVTQSARSTPDESLRLNFAGERFDFEPLSVGFVLAAVKDEESKRTWQQSGPLVGKIVLLGGNYRAARDSHVTPVGTLSGVQVIAQAIESEISGGGIRTLNHGVAFLLDVALGGLLAWVHYRLHHRVALALGISLVLTPVLCLIASYAAFSTFGLWFNFVAVAVSVLIHQLYEHARESQRLRAAV